MAAEQLMQMKKPAQGMLSDTLFIIVTYRAAVVEVQPICIWAKNHSLYISLSYSRISTSFTNMNR